MIDKKVFYVNVKNKKYFFSYNRTSFNTQASASMCFNKYLSKVLVEKYLKKYVKTIPFFYELDKHKFLDFLKTHKKVIKKPLFGQKHKNIEILDQSENFSLLNKDFFNGFIFEKFLQKSIEYRVVVFDKNIVGFQEKVVKNYDDFSLFYKGLKIEDSELNKKLFYLAKKINDLFDLRYSAVDFLYFGNKIYFLEINSAPGLKKMYNPDIGVKHKVAHKIVKSLI